MIGTSTKILKSLRDRGEMKLEDVAKILPRKFGDHRDFYPLASLVSQGYVENSYSSFSSMPEKQDLASKNQLIAWKLYAMSAADKSATYKGHHWSIHGGDESLKGQILALTGSGYLRLEEGAVRRNDRLFSIGLAVLSAALAAVATSLFSIGASGA